MKKSEPSWSLWIARSLLMVLVILAAALQPSGAVQGQAEDPLSLTPGCCGAAGAVGTSLTRTFRAAGGSGGYTFTTGGEVPGLRFENVSANEIELTGIPIRAGSYNLSITVRDSRGGVASTSGTLVVDKMTPTLTISQAASTHPDSLYMLHYPVTVVVVFNGSSLVDPAENIQVTSGEGSPSCTALLDPDTASRECDLIFTEAGSYSISASYPGDDNYNPSAVVNYSANPIVMTAFSATPALTAGVMHSCFLRPDANFSCWGYNDPYELDAEGNPLVYGPVIAVSAGGYHTCFIKTDNTVQCWGDNPGIKNYPNATGRSFVRISSGRDFACAIDTRSRLYCWGTLPDGLSGHPAGKYTSISAGSGHACALSSSNASPTCWGNNSDGQRTAPAGISGLKAISAGNKHTCAITSTNALSCWGLLSESPPSGTDYIQLESGSDYSCAQRSNARLACWGNGKPPVDSGINYSGFASGFLHTCAWIENSPKNYLSCWGENASHQAPRLTLSPNAFTSFINYIPLGATWSQRFTSAGGASPYTLTLQSATLPSGALVGSTITWTPAVIGNNTFSLTLSEDGAGSSLPLELTPLAQTYPLYVQSPETSVAVTLGAASVNAGSPVTVSVQVNKTASPPLSGSVVVTGTDGSHSSTCQSQISSTDGTASCTLYLAYAGATLVQAQYSGNDFYHGSTSANAALTVAAVSISPAVSAGNQFTCSLDSAGIATCWGKNDAGQGTPLESVYRQLSAGDGYTCGSSLNASLYCWGWDGYGLNHPQSSSIYQAVASGSTHACGLTWGGAVNCWGNSAGGRTSVPAAPYGTVYTALTAGDNHTCALNGSGTVTCWGVNTNGQTSVPVAAFSKISAGGSFTCGVLTSGALECWGGITTVDAIRAEPAGSVFTDLDAGWMHACALRNDNLVQCWGDATNGKATPPARTFSSISAGKDHTCGIRQKTATLSNDVLECWGNNTLGQAPSIAIAPETLPTIDTIADTSSDPAIQISASGGRSGHFSYAVAPGSSLPAGLTIDSTNGQITGTPVNAGEYDFTVRVLEDQRTPALIAERAYHLTVQSQVAVEITSVTPLDPSAGEPVTIQVLARETPGSTAASPPGGTISVQSADGKSCLATLIAGAQSSSGSCTILFTTEGQKSLSASYPGDEYFLEGGTAEPQIITVSAFTQQPRIYTDRQRTIVHQADGSLFCMGANCLMGGLTGRVTAVDVGENLACGLGLDGQVRCQAAISPPGTAQAVLDNGPYTGLAVGALHACAIRLNGSVFCWGENSAGQVTAPAGVFAALSAGAAHTCGIRDSGQLACWGSGDLPPAGQYQAVSAGTNHSCALADTGTVSCWGDNSSQQSDPPAGIFTELHAGEEHSCALAASGQITCWGSNEAGQSSPPYGIFTTFSSGANHNCALRPDLGLTCWGGSEYGEAPQISVSTLSTTSLVAKRYWDFAFNPAGGVRPYQGSVSEGQLPGGINMEVNLSTAGVILYGTPQTPGVFPFVLLWRDAATISRPLALVLEKPFALRVTGADLAVGILPAGLVAVADNLFHFTYTIDLLSDLPVPEVAVAVDVPEELADVTFSGLDDCVLSGRKLQCSITTLNPGAAQTLTVEGRITSKSGTNLSTQVEVASPLADWPEVAPANNSAGVSIPVANEAVVYEDDFSGPDLPGIWSGGTLISSPSGVTYLGDFDGGSDLQLEIEPLAPHRTVEVTFDLYVIGPWQGNNLPDPGSPSLWTVGEPGQPAMLSTTFCNMDGCMQAYPDSYPGGSSAAWTGAAGKDELGFAGLTDSRYRITLRFAHTAELLHLTLSSAGLPAGAKWGIDNVAVKIGSGMSRVYLPQLRMR